MISFSSDVIFSFVIALVDSCSIFDYTYDENGDDDDDDDENKGGNLMMIKEGWDEVDMGNNGMEARKK